MLWCKFCSAAVGLSKVYCAEILMKHLYIGAACCLATAAMLAAAAAPTQWTPLAFIALLPLISRDRDRARTRFLFGWASGFLTQCFSYYWIFYTIRDFQGAPPWLAALGAFAFLAYQGLDLALWLCFYPAAARRLSKPDQPHSRALAEAVCAAVGLFALQRWLFPAIFPWHYGNLLNGAPLLMKAGALWGVHGLSFWLVFLQVWLWKLPLRGAGRHAAWATLGLAAVVLGAGILCHRTPQTDVWRVGVVQPNMIPWAKRGRIPVEDRVRAHLEPTLSFKERGVDLVVWPETAMSFVMTRSDHYQRQLRYLAKELNAPIVTGTLGFEEPRRFFNEIWMITPDDQPAQVYRKQKLVLFSERLPWILSWIKRFDSALGGFTAGTGTPVFEWRERRFIPMVCFEALLSDYVRRYEGHAILNLTNDAWFGETKASALHLMMIQARTTERGIPLIRATNSGISCWINSDGTVHQPSPLYTAQADIYEVPIPRTPSANLLWLGDLLIAATCLTACLWLRFGANKTAGVPAQITKGPA